MDMRYDRLTPTEMTMAEMVADAAIEKVVDEISQDFDEGSQDWTIIQAAKEYKVEVYPDGTCDLIHESAYEPEEDEEDTLTFEEDEERVYHLKLKCANCGHSWDQEIPFGMDFFPFSLGDTHWEAGYGHPKANTGHRSSVGKELIQCPKCGSHKAEREVIPWFTAKQREVKP